MTPDEIRSSLSTLSAAGTRAARAGDKISESADERRAAVVARMAELSDTALVDKAAADEYSALVSERGRLDIVLGHQRS